VTLSAAARKLLDEQRIAHLATADREGRPHVVPLCYAHDGERLYFIVDEKPKAAGKRRKRMRNIDENPEVALLVDVYDEDWARLQYLMIRGRALVVEDPTEFARALSLLRGRYPQYVAMRLVLGRNELVRIEPTSAHHWKGAPAE